MSESYFERCANEVSTNQEPRRTVRITRLLFEIPILCLRRRQLEKIRREILRISTKTEPKSTKNRCKIDLGRFLALKTVSGTRRDALGTGPGRQKKTPGSILGRPGRAKSAWEPVKSLLGPVLGRSRTTSKRSLSALSAPSAVEHDRGMILRCFCRAVHKLET